SDYPASRNSPAAGMEWPDVCRRCAGQGLCHGWQDLPVTVRHRKAHHRRRMVRPEVLQIMSGASSRLRCAVYTRKSSDEGLEQEFNSLDAQYEACQAYIASQASLGWKLVPGRYDDGGISGGTMERPALKR